MSKGKLAYALFGALCVFVFLRMNLYGWGGSGSSQQPVPKNEVANLRRTGTTGFIYWHHGMRGK